MTRIVFQQRERTVDYVSPARKPFIIEDSHNDTTSKETMREHIERVYEDLEDLKKFYNIEISPDRANVLQEYYTNELEVLKKLPFDKLDRQDKIDYLLIKNYIKRESRQIDLDIIKDKATKPLLPFANIITRLCQHRQQGGALDAQAAAQDVYTIGSQILKIKEDIKSGKIHVDKDQTRSSAFRAAKTLDQLGNHLKEWYEFYSEYDPSFSWWVVAPYKKTYVELQDLTRVIREVLVEIKPGEEDAIVGEPIGREGLLADLEAEMICYSPEELISIAEKEDAWCVTEMLKASQDLGYGNDWRAALEHVKTQYVPPGEQPTLVRDLLNEAVSYMKAHNLVTVPPLAASIWRMYMMSPAAQKANPFFLGGDSIIVSYPTSTMPHPDKLMTLRGNNRHFARATVFHEMIPGHHLQFHMLARHRPYRRLFETPFWIEGWALYWEYILWDKDFPKSPEDRIGMLFWRMHRCARILFSLNFHLGKWSPERCIEYLVNHVGHDRWTAEGEVRRSFGGEYTPLYQAGYMLGALQLYALRGEVVERGERMAEKEFHDTILKQGTMPIELLRALVKGKDDDLTPDFKSTWRFYEGLRR